MWDDLGDYVKKTVAAHHDCIKDHYAALEQAAADQAPDPQQTAEQATIVIAHTMQAMEDMLASFYAQIAADEVPEP